MSDTFYGRGARGDLTAAPDYIDKRNGHLCDKELLYKLTRYDADHFYQDSYGASDADVLKGIF